MTYFELTPFDLLREILMYIDDPVTLTILDNAIQPFDTIFKDYVFWIKDRKSVV